MGFAATGLSALLRAVEGGRRLDAGEALELLPSVAALELLPAAEDS